MMVARSTALVLLLLTSACTESRRSEAPAAATSVVATPVPPTEVASTAPPAPEPSSSAEIAATTPPAPGPSGWAGKWKRRALPSMVGDLEITHVTATGFHFDVSLMHGAHQGGVEGDATFTPEGARFEWPADREPRNECALTFVRKDGAIVLSQQHDCSLTMGFGVRANGEYHREGEVQAYATTFDCAKATSSVDRAVCEHEALALADIGLGARDSARIRREVSCPDGREVERCVAGAYRKRFTALRGSTGRGFDLAGMRRAAQKRPVVGMASGRRLDRTFRTPAPAWHELELYLIEQLPRERYEKLESHRLEDEHLTFDATGIVLESCAPFCCDCMASYVRVEASGVWVALDGNNEVVFTPKAPEAEPDPLRAWLAGRKIEGAERVRVFE